jgi:hypothetical protein
VGPIPHKHKLTIAAAFVRTDEYDAIVRGKVLPRHSSRYMVTFQKLLFQGVHHARERCDKLALAFEYTKEYHRPIEEMAEVVADVPEIMALTTMKKGESPTFEVADYLSFQLYHWLITPITTSEPTQTITLEATNKFRVITNRRQYGSFRCNSFYSRSRSPQ